MALVPAGLYYKAIVPPTTINGRGEAISDRARAVGEGLGKLPGCADGIARNIHQKDNNEKGEKAVIT